MSSAVDLIRVEDRYYILASSSFADDRTRTLKDNDTFAVFDRSGDVVPVGRGQQGVYHDSTRYLSRLELRVEGQRLLLLSSTVTEDNSRIAVDLTNPILGSSADGLEEQDRLHLSRSLVLRDAACHQRIQIHNYAAVPVRFELSLSFGADFADVFEVRGIARARRGEYLEPRIRENSVVLRYRGLDAQQRTVTVRLQPDPTRLTQDRASYGISLSASEETTIDLCASFGEGESVPTELDYPHALGAARNALSRHRAPCQIDTSNERFNDWLNRSRADMSMMLSETAEGTYPYAGVPWFNAPFGRDGILTALETLWIDPSVSAAVLRFLAATQATEEDPDSEAQPGKILHEARGGEMCALGEVPFRRYYGTVDATPLFVILAHAYYIRTGDRDLTEEIWPSVLRALSWIDRCGDPDGDGFVEYERRTPTGLVHQGWKDSHDSIFHSDGSLAEGPIALCEVQAYVYGAKCGAAELARVLGETERASALGKQARELRESFERHFWDPELDTYVLALDGQKRPCRVRASNAGQCLWPGIASPERAQRVAQTLMGPDSFSGWGVRTLSASEKRYNPMSYHNGSVWPHDNALIAAGMARYGLREPTLAILAGLFDASLFTDLSRLPELVCGFARRPGEGPTLYPVACAPQSWAAASVYLLLQSCLGLEISAVDKQIRFHSPVLPPFLERLRIHNLRVGESSVDLQLARHPNDVSVQVLNRRGSVDIMTLK